MSSAPSPRPLRATAHLELKADPSIVDRILDAADWPELKRWAEIALGPSSFELGVCCGIVENLASSVVGLLGLLKTFILAGLYVRANRAPAWWDVLGLPEYLAAKGAELVLGSKLKEAHDQCEALMREVMKAVKNPRMFLGKAKDHYVNLYTEKWTRFQSLVVQTNLTSKFEAGKIFGEVLLDVLMLVMTVAGAAETAARLAGEVPELVKLAGNFKGVLKLKPGPARSAGAVSTIEEAGITGEEAEAAGRRRQPTEDVKSAVQDSRPAFAGSIRNVNPTGGGMNCVNCSLATDATLSGHPASALPGGATPISVLEKTFSGKFASVTGPSEIESRMLSAGPGAQGIVYVRTEGTGVGHVFNVVNQKGTIRFLDGQTGTQFDWTGQFEDVRLLMTK